MIYYHRKVFSHLFALILCGALYFGYSDIAQQRLPRFPPDISRSALKGVENPKKVGKSGSGSASEERTSGPFGGFSAKAPIDSTSSMPHVSNQQAISFKDLPKVPSAFEVRKKKEVSNSPVGVSTSSLSSSNIRGNLEKSSLQPKNLRMKTMQAPPMYEAKKIAKDETPSSSITNPSHNHGIPPWGPRHEFGEEILPLGERKRKKYWINPLEYEEHQKRWSIPTKVSKELNIYERPSNTPLQDLLPWKIDTLEQEASPGDELTANDTQSIHLPKFEVVAIFEVFDKNHDGIVTAQELLAASKELTKENDDNIETIMKIRNETYAGMIAIMDHNKDKNITFDEFQDYLDSILHNREKHPMQRFSMKGKANYLKQWLHDKKMKRKIINIPRTSEDPFGRPPSSEMLNPQSAYARGIEHIHSNAMHSSQHGPLIRSDEQEQLDRMEQEWQSLQMKKNKKLMSGAHGLQSSKVLHSNNHNSFYKATPIRYIFTFYFVLCDCDVIIRYI